MASTQTWMGILLVILGAIVAWIAISRGTRWYSEHFEESPTEIKRGDNKGSEGTGAALDEDGKQIDEKKAYQNRLFTLRIFDAILNRNPSDEELKTYETYGTEKAILAAVIEKHHLLEGDDRTKQGMDKEKKSDAASDNESKASVDKKNKKEVEHPSDLSKDRTSDGVRNNGRNTVKKSSSNAALSRTYSPSTSSDDNESDTDNESGNVVPVEENGVGGYNNPPFAVSDLRQTKSLVGEEDDVRNRLVCIHKADALRRLKTIASEASQFYHLLSMY
jgi:hypothetical protein